MPVRLSAIRRSIDQRFFPVLRQTLTETGIIIETPLRTADPATPKSRLPLAATTLVQFDGDIVTFVRPQAPSAAMQEHWRLVAQALNALASELKLVERCGLLIRRGVQSGRICLIGGAVSGSEIITGTTVLTEIFAAVGLWPAALAVGGIAIGAATEGSSRILRWRVKQYLTRQGIAL